MSFKVGDRVLIWVGDDKPFHEAVIAFFFEAGEPYVVADLVEPLPERFYPRRVARTLKSIKEVAG